MFADGISCMINIIVGQRNIQGKLGSLFIYDFNNWGNSKSLELNAWDSPNDLVLCKICI